MPSITKPTPSSPDAGFWRSLAELHEGANPDLGAEFTPEMMDEPDGPTRRRFIQLMGASAALAGAVGCSKQFEKIVPAVRSVPGRVLGQTIPYASSTEINGVGYGLLVTSYDGRPIKIDGNPKHPLNRGTTTMQLSASMLELYDPDRSKEVVHRVKGNDEPANWSDFIEAAKARMAEQKGKAGAGLAILAGSTSSVTLASLKDRLLKAYPQAKWYEYEPVSRDHERVGTKLVFGQSVRPIYHLDKAKIICSLDTDLFQHHPAAMQYSRDFGARRDPEITKADQFSRLYAFESNLSSTGAVADHRVPMKSSAIGKIAKALLAAVKGTGTASGLSGKAEKIFSALVDDLKQHKGACVVAAGYNQPAAVHALAQQINIALGAVGTTVSYVSDPDGDRPSHADAIKNLVADAQAGKVDTLVILGGNPVYNAPSDLKFSEVLKKIGHSIHVGLYRDETGSLCDWHVPQAHFLESWGDCRSWDGTLSVIQPLIEPLYSDKSYKVDTKVINYTARSFAEVLSVLLETPTKGYDLVRSAMKPIISDSGFEAKWQTALKDGIVESSAYKTITPKPVDANIPDVEEVSGLEAIFVADAKLFDGRYANNAWLQECPDFATKLVWDNAILMSLKTAEKNGLKHSDMTSIKIGDKEMTAAVFIQPGQANDSVTLLLGYGRTKAGVVGGRVAGGVTFVVGPKAVGSDPIGFDFYPLRTTAAMNFVGNVQLSPRGGKYGFATTQEHHQVDTTGLRERDKRMDVLVREATISEYSKDQDLIKNKVHPLPLFQLFEGEAEKKNFKYDHKWGMTIDMSRCVGCNACVVACQSENNIPVVGKEQVRRGREMHWMRIDRYFKGTEADPYKDSFEEVSVYHQPLTCMHCENAPCEQVCPVAATLHSHEGTNDMIYNRCVGTRYCSNNCPYKVRRFNFYNWHAPINEGPEANAVLKNVFNPEVTVRSRGVMEKCTYCIHRIRAAKIRLKNEAVASTDLKGDKTAKYDLKDGELITACQQACPAGAITFGDLSNEKSKVYTLQNTKRAYAMLGEMNLRPRTIYMGRIRNPHPSLASHKPDSHDAGHSKEVTTHG